MTETEWIKMGYMNNIIDVGSSSASKTFSECYEIWFRQKMKLIKPQSVDRIDVTYRKYFSSFSSRLIDKIDEVVIIQFLNCCIINYKITYKEFCRIYQIVNNVLVYALDFQIAGAHLLDWGKIRRCCNLKGTEHNERTEYIVSVSDRQVLFDSVFRCVYPLKQSACYCLVLNFYLGLRVGELAALKFTDFDLRSNTVTVRRTEVKYCNRDIDGFKMDSMHYYVSDSLKTANSYRVLPLLPEALVIFHLLRNWHDSHGYNSEYLCYDGDDTIASRSLTRTLTRLCQICELKHINTHLIRKTYASLLHQHNIPTRVISDLMGHSDINTTERSYILNYQASYDIYRSEIEKALCLKPQDYS